MTISARSLSSAERSSLNCSGCWSRAFDMKDFSRSAKRTGFVRLKGTERMFVFIAQMTWEVELELFLDRRAKVRGLYES